MDNILYAYLETTNHCNLSCSFCNRKDVIGALNHMPIDKWVSFLEKIKDQPLKECKLMGMGEPFLHPQFDIITGTFKKYFPNTKVIVATNCQYNIKDGSPMRKKLENALEHIDLLYLSIDGYEDNYERDRSPAKWSKLIDFLNNFKNIDKKNCTVAINYVVNRNNLYDIEKIRSFVDEYNLHEFRLNIAQDWSEDKTITSSDKTWGYSEDELDYLKTFNEYIKGKSPWTWSDCFWPKNGLYTTVSGDIKMCCLNTGAKSLGNIFTDDLNDVRSSEAYQKIANGCSSNNPEKHCVNCSYKELSPMLEHLNVDNK